MNSRLSLFSIVFGLLSWVSVAQAIDLKGAPKLQEIADQLIAEQHYTQAELDAIFAKATVQQSVIDAMSNPAEYRLTWGKYRKIFLGEERIQQGVEFWREYQDDLARAEKEYGVPANIIVAIIGVETKFGRIKGKHKVLDSLVSLVVGYPRRSAFFAKELKHFLILTKENQMNADEILGSYAGAVGYPQFISSSYRSYAVDFSGDGKADLIDEPVDAIGSVANYFIENGWKPGEAVTSEQHVSISNELKELANRKRKTRFSAKELRSKGANIAGSVPDTESLNVLMLDASEVVPDSKEKGIYIVRAGDTACQIAERHDVACNSLFALNKLNKDGKIFRGQRLKLPVSVKENSTASAKKTVVKSGKWTVVDSAKDGSPNTDRTSSKKSGGQADGSSSDGSSKPRYFYTHHNFYAITKYNHSVLYAMAVYDLSVAIANAKQQADNLNASSF